MKKFGSSLWGLVFIAVGIIVGLNSFKVTNIDLFFNGWWTLFIIVPCFIGLFTDNDKTGDTVGLAVGVILLLCCQDILNFDILWKLLLPIILIIIGGIAIGYGINLVINGVLKKLECKNTIIEEDNTKFKKTK